MEYYYVPIILDYFDSGLNWKSDFDSKKLMKVKSNLQAQKEASELYELEKEKNLGFGIEVYSVFTVNDKQQKDLKSRYPKEAIFLPLKETEMYVSNDKNKKQWIKSPVRVTYSRT